MTIRHSFLVAACTFGLAAASPAFAQTISAGAAVKDTDGGEVGTIASVDGDHVVLRTDRHEVRLPASSFAVTEDGLLFAMTREALNAEVDRVQAQAEASMRVGASVRDRDGVTIGPITDVDADTVTIDLGGRLVRLPRNALAATPDGPVTGATRAELEAAAAGQ